MKKYFFLLLLYCANGNAQPVLSRADTIKMGDIYNYTWCNKYTTPSIVNDTGANKSWDFSNFQQTSEYSIDSIVAIFSTSPSTMFPDANLVDNSTVQAAGFYPKSHSYFKTYPDSILVLGSQDENGFSAYSPPIEYSRKHPFTYGNMDVDSFAYTYSYSGITDSGIEIDTIVAVGYGRIKLPNNVVYDSVLQLKKTRTLRGNYGVSQDVTIDFFKPGIALPIFSERLSGYYISTVQYLNNYSSLYRRLTFIGTGNWSSSSNWLNGVTPPTIIPAGTIVTIRTPAGGQCIIDIPVTFESGAFLIISPNSSLLVQGNLTIH